MKALIEHRPILLSLLLGLCVSATAAQNEQTGTTHKHYDDSPAAQTPGPQGELAPRLQNLGAHVFPVSTQNTQTQAFINQGLNLAFAFNHGEARRAVREAARLDPKLAMAYWAKRWCWDRTSTP